MESQKQEQLFDAIRKRFPRWSKRKCSGYLHGILDEAKFKRPCHIQLKAFSPKRSYAVGYVYGFIDARGEDAFRDPWLRDMKHRLVTHAPDVRWWLK